MRIVAHDPRRDVEFAGGGGVGAGRFGGVCRVPLNAGVLRAVALAVVVGASASCSTLGFYVQAVGGQAEIMLKRRPVERVLADSATDDALRGRLELARELLAFAEAELDMTSGGSFSGYADLGRDHAVWVVHAAQEFSMEPVTWWYPVTGRMAYRGYFREAVARRTMSGLEEAGHDVWVARVDAYSTLGYFRDPLLNTFIHRDVPMLADLIFHELAHQRHFRRGETAFNEGLAEAVAREGVRRWLAARGYDEALAGYERRLRRQAAAGVEIRRTARRLEGIYASGTGEEAMRAAKEREIAELKRRLAAMGPRPGTGLDSWVRGEVNNARINSFIAYEEEVPRFVRLLDECGGDFQEFWKRVEALEVD